MEKEDIPLHMEEIKQERKTRATNKRMKKCDIKMKETGTEDVPVKTVKIKKEQKPKIVRLKKNIPKTETRIIQCIVPSCLLEVPFDDSLKLPKRNSKRFHRWCNVLRIPIETALSKPSFRICKNHFEPKKIRRKIIKNKFVLETKNRCPKLHPDLPVDNKVEKKEINIDALEAVCKHLVEFGKYVKTINESRKTRTCNTPINFGYPYYQSRTAKTCHLLGINKTVMSHLRYSILRHRWDEVSNAIPFLNTNIENISTLIWKLSLMPFLFHPDTTADQLQQFLKVCASPTDISPEKLIKSLVLINQNSDVNEHATVKKTRSKKKESNDSEQQPSSSLEKSNKLKPTRKVQTNKKQNSSPSENKRVSVKRTSKQKINDKLVVDLQASFWSNKNNSNDNEPVAKKKKI